MGQQTSKEGHNSSNNNGSGRKKEPLRFSIFIKEIPLGPALPTTREVTERVTTQR
jgi:hypothetical protein